MSQIDNNKDLQPIDFNWDDDRWKGHKGSKLFEELCWELIDLEGFQNLEWRGDTHDKGRDLQADYIIQDPANKTRTEKWWFQCKRYSSSINLSDMGNAFDHAESENIDVFVIMSTSTLTNTFQEMIEKWNEKKIKPFQTLNYNYKSVEKLVKDHIQDITNLEKYFDLNRDIEKVREELSRKEQQQIEEAYQLKEELDEKIDAIKSDPSNFNLNKLEGILEICNQIFQASLKNEAIQLLSKLSKIDELEDIIQYHIQLNLGDFYVKREWVGRSIRHYAKAEEKHSTSEELYRAKLKKGRALRLDNDFRKSEKELLDILKSVKDSSESQYFKSCLELFELYYEKEDIEKAKKYLIKITKKTGDLYYKKLYSEIKIANTTGKWEKTREKFENLTLNKIPFQIRLNIMMESAFAYFQQQNFDKAINILEKKCLPLVEDSGDEDRLMVIYRNITHIKNARQDLHTSYWESYSKWSNLYSKNLSNYHNARLKGLNATDLILNQKYNKAIDSLNKSHRIFSEIGSWNSLKKNQERKGYAFFKKNEYIDALDQFIRSNSIENIERTSSKLLQQTETTSTNKLIEKYLGKNNLTISASIGFCHAISHLHEIISDEIFPDVLEQLFNLSLKKFSINKNFDIKRPAIEALIKVSYRIEEDKALEIIEKTFKKAKSKKSFWDVRQKLLKLYTNLEHTYPNIISEQHANELLKLLKDQTDSSNDIISAQLTNLLYQVAKNNSKLREQLIDFLKDQKPNSIILLNLINFETNIETESAKKLINKAEDIISNRVIIETDFEEDDPNPNISHSGFTSTSIRDGKKITVGSLPDLSYLTRIDLENYDQKLVKNLIDTIVEQINYKENSVQNRISLLNLTTNLKVNSTQTKKLNSLYWSIINNEGLEFRDKDKREFLLFIDKSKAVNLSKAYAIRGLNNNFDHIDKKEEFENLIKENSLSDSSDIRSVVVEAISNLKFDNEEIFLKYFAILNSSEKEVVQKCISIIDEKKNEMLSKSKTYTLSDILIYFLNKFDDSPEVLIRLKKVLKIFLESDKVIKHHNLIETKINDLKSHRFYSVRNSHLR